MAYGSQHNCCIVHLAFVCPLDRRMCKRLTVRLGRSDLPTIGPECFLPLALTVHPNYLISVAVHVGVPHVTIPRPVSRGFAHLTNNNTLG